MTASASPPGRDQSESAFAAILANLVRRLPGAFAAALVDWDGECVDYAAVRRSKRDPELDPFEVKVAAAHWAIVLDELAERPALGAPRTIVCRGDRRSFFVRTLPDRYALVVLLKKRAGFAARPRALDACERALAREADWALPKGRGVWVPVEVEIDARARPAWLTMGALSCGVEVLGAFTRLSKRERGFRVRLAGGGELNLVREAGDHWYADEMLA